MACSGCNSEHIQNKKYNLCGECVFKKSHGGKSKAEVYQERANKKPKKTYEFKGRKISQPISYTKEKSGITWSKTEVVVNGEVIGELKSIDPKYFQDEESRKNEINQNMAELAARREAKANGEVFDLDDYEEKNLIERVVEVNKIFPKKKKKQKPLKQVSAKQAPIERAYKLTCIDMDHTTEPICTGCERYQGGDIRLSHSHLISRADCQRIGRPELISERKNLTYHCIDFGENEGCHSRWENPAERHLLLDYEQNVKIIEELAPELLPKYTSKMI